MIRDIDNFAEKELSVPVVTLMERSGEAVANAVKRIGKSGCRVIILCGGGNNGGDGYAAAIKLMDLYNVTVFDVLCKGQKSESGKYWRAEYIKRRGKLFYGIPSKQKISRGADVIVDAIFGTGFSGQVPSELISLSEYINSKEHIKVVAADIPLGVSADDGCVEKFALRCDVTVSLSFPKLAMFSYPAKEYVGEVIIDRLGLDERIIGERFLFKDSYVDFSLAKMLLPKRADNTNKGSFGKAMLIAGSREFMGASALALEAALRGGAGYVSFLGNDSLCDYLLGNFPEAIYKRVALYDREEVILHCEKQDSVLIGSGSGCTRELYEVVERLVTSRGAALVIDADAVNSIAKYGSAEIFKNAKRDVILTPHPLEFSRISGLSVEYIQANRYRAAKNFAKEYGCVLLLKGAGTIVTDGEYTYVNGSGSSALAKAGSGDVLAGLLTSILACLKSPIKSAALAAYIHGKVGDLLADEYSHYGVTPSDIPKMAAKIMAELEKE